jgi:hypothetical protein
MGVQNLIYNHHQVDECLNKLRITRNISHAHQNETVAERGSRSKTS